MKQLILFIVCLCSLFGVYGQANDNNTISTLRLGAFKLFTKKTEAENVIGKPLIMPSNTNNYDGTSKIVYNGEKYEITIGNYYFDNNKEDTVIISIKTTSKSFKTKSGIGVGSSKNDVINAFKDQRSFSLYPGYDDNGISKTISYFVLRDVDASTNIVFKLSNNIVVEITVTVESEGC